MGKKRIIGFRDSSETVPSNKNEEEEDVTISAEEIENNIKDQQSFEMHMNEYNKLVLYSKIFKYSVAIIGFIGVILIAYFFGYNKGCRDQLAGNGNCITITDNQNKKYIINKYNIYEVK